ncbi:hypothetical protein L596_026919 [Steinernema carpocapsae]|uniref:Metalloendopeptidase n=1 Tax=Steinernema carpocapsae TaxID=34508 RepID=A0A4U5M2S6_STECR|nr:hypothetical protein L596_026919 [Steinernema carpocapsae]
MSFSESQIRSILIKPKLPTLIYTTTMAALSYCVALTTFCLTSTINPLLQGYDEAARNDLEYVRKRLQELNPSPFAKYPENGAIRDSEQPDSIPEINQPFAEYLYQGDITLTPAQVEHIVSSRSKRQAINLNNPHFKRWSQERNGSIPYFFHGFDANQRGLIKRAIQFWEDHTCVKFQEIDNGGRGLQITYAGPHGPCNSYIGKTDHMPQQVLNLGYHCLQFGTIIHELGHALGMFHEHTRADRAQYVTIREDNLAPGIKHNFDIHRVVENDNQGVEYDYGSIMHYSQSKLPCLLSLKPTNFSDSIICQKRTNLCDGSYMEQQSLH